MERKSSYASGNFRLKQAVLETNTHRHNIIELIEQIDIVEGMMEGFSHGELRIKDTVGLIDSISSDLAETATVIISWSTDHEADCEVIITKTFGIATVAYVTDSNVVTKTVKMVLESKPAILNEFKRVSKSYPARAGVTPAIKDLLAIIGVTDRQMKLEETQTCSGSQDSIIIPNITPLEAIEHLCVLGVSASNAKMDTASRSVMYFFEGGNDIKFVSLGTLNASPMAANIRWDSAPTISDTNRALSFQRSELFDTIRSARSGSRGATYYEHSIVNKMLRCIQSETVKPKGVFNSNVTWNKELANDYHNAFTKYQTTDGMYAQQTTHPDSFIQRRVIRSRIMDQKAVLTVPGNAKIIAGSIIQLTVPTASGEASPADSGKWIVSRAVHHLSRQSYTIDIELIRDSDIANRGIL